VQFIELTQGYYAIVDDDVLDRILDTYETYEDAAWELAEDAGLSWDEFIELLEWFNRI